MIGDRCRKVLIVGAGEAARMIASEISCAEEINASVEGFIYNTNDVLCAKARGDFTTLSPKLAKRLGMMTDDHIKEFFEPIINQ